jgi:hypothetical protein
MESGYVNINIVYVIGRMNGYWIVVIDGYDRPRIKCHGWAKNAATLEPTLQPSIVVKNYSWSAIVKFMRYNHTFGVPNQGQMLDV